MQKNTSITKKEIFELANNLDNEQDSFQVSGIFIGNEIGFPLRIFSEESNTNGGEPKNYSNAYDKACEVLDTEKCESYEERGFVWFTQSST